MGRRSFIDKILFISEEEKIDYSRTNRLLRDNGYFKALNEIRLWGMKFEGPISKSELFSIIKQLIKKRLDGSNSR